MKDSVTKVEEDASKVENQNKTAIKVKNWNDSATEPEENATKVWEDATEVENQNESATEVE